MLDFGFTTLASTITFIPRLIRASAAPDFELKFLLPCLATFTPAPATTKADAVEMLSVPYPVATGANYINRLVEHLQKCT